MNKKISAGISHFVSMRGFDVVLYRLPSALLLLLCVFITISSLITVGNQEEKLTIIPPVVIVLPSAVLFIMLLIYINDKCIRTKQSTHRINLVVALILMCFLQILLMVIMPRIYPITDCYTTLDEAASMFEQGGILDNSTDYFARYPNNYLFTIVMYYLFGISRCLGLDYFTYACAINILIIDLTVFLGFKVARLIFDEKRANMFLILSVLCPTNYVFVFFPYTNTFSMPFIAGIVLCGLKKGYRYKVGFVILSVVGCCLRPTTIFASIGVLIYMILKRKTININKKNIIKMIILILLAVVILMSEKLFVRAHLQIPDNEKDFPVTHWIMVGLNGTGEVTGDDVRFTQSYETKAEKVDANLKEIKKRVNKLGVLGLGKLMLTKTAKIWAVGTDDFQNYFNSTMEYNDIYNVFFGDNNTWLIIYSQIFRSSSFLLIVIMLFFSFRKRHIDCRIVPIIALLGIIVFLMIWETNKKHSICYTPILTIMMLYGIDIIGKLKWYYSRKENAKFSFRRLGLICAHIISLLLILENIFIFLYQNNKQDKRNVLFRSEYNMNYLSCKDHIISQTVNPNSEFNMIEIHMKSISRKKGKPIGNICIKLIHDNRIIIKKDIDSLISRDEWVKLDGFVCEPGEYHIEISSTKNCDGVEVAYYSGKKMEHYYHSVLLVDGEKMKSSALSVRIYKKNDWGI